MSGRPPAVDEKPSLLQMRALRTSLHVFALTLCVQPQTPHPTHMPGVREAFPALSVSCVEQWAGSWLPPLPGVHVGARMNRLKCFLRALKLAA